MATNLVIRPEPAPSNTLEEFRRAVNKWTRDAEKAFRALAASGAGTASSVSAPQAGLPVETVRYGEGAPLDALGNDGDFYIATDIHYIYGPRANGVWPAGASLIGPAGAPGPDLEEKFNRLLEYLLRQGFELPDDLIADL